MPRHSPFDIILSAGERTELLRRATSQTLPYSTVVRAKMILLAATGMPNDLIAEKLGTRREVVSRWRKRFFLSRLPGLEDSAHPGRPPKRKGCFNGAETVGR